MLDSIQDRISTAFEEDAATSRYRVARDIFTDPDCSSSR